MKYLNVVPTSLNSSKTNIKNKWVNQYKKNFNPQTQTNQQNVLKMNGGKPVMILQRKLMKFVEEKYPKNEITVKASMGDAVVFKMNTPISLKEFTTAVKNEFPCVEFDYPVDESLVIVTWK